MKVKDLIEVLKKQDKNAEVEMEIVCEEGHSIAYCIDGTYLDEFYDEDGEKNTVNLYFDETQH
tara:strand:+ start:1057 stop:1245 length:189 start_codon:yes stop_codon:yes gene_type:complete